jgi:uncharacterized protein DUF4340
MRRNTLVLLALALAFGAYLYFGEIRGAERKQEAEKASHKLVGIAAADLTSLELPTSGGGRARLQKAAGGWRLAEPLDFAVDSFTVDRLVEAVAGLASKAEIEGAGDLSLFGLDDSAPRIVARAGDAPPIEIRLGKSTPVGSARYVQVSSRPGRVFTVDTVGTSPLEPSLADLRDKRLLHGEKSAVDRLVVQLSAESRQIELAKQDGAWKLLAPVQARADGERIERLIDDLDLARASGFVDTPGAPAEYGLERPAVEIELGRADKTESLALGKAGDKAYARVPGVASVLEIPDRIVDGIPRAVFEYRYKRVLTLEDAKVAGLELAFPRENVTHRFKRDDQTWKPEETDLKIDSVQLADLVFAIEALDATGLEEGGESDLARFGLAPPRVRVTARDAAGAELGWLELGDPDPTHGLAARSSAGPEIWRVENNLGEQVPLSADAFKTKFAPKPEGSAAPPGTPATPAPPAPAAP